MTQTIGQRLREIRESRGISLDEIAQQTHIKLAYLRAIEEGDLESLPSKIQMRGFLRLYAVELGLKINDLQVEGYHLTPAAAAKHGEAASGTGETDQVEPVPDQEAEQTETQDQPELEAEKEPLPPVQPGESAPLEEQKPTATEPFVEELQFEEEQEIEQEEESEVEPLPGPSADQIFKEIGEQLAQRRDILSLSLKDVEAHIHVRGHYLNAIEEGRFMDLPSPVTARGMLSNYAEFLNLDVDSIMLYFAEGLQKRRLENQVEQPTRRQARALSPNALRLKNFFSLDLLVIVLLFITFAGFVIWGVNRILSADLPAAAGEELPEVADVLLATGSPTPDQTITPGGTTTAEAEETEEGDMPAEGTPLFTDLPNNNPINIVVIPLQNVWVQVTADGEEVFAGRLLTGNAYDYSAAENLALLTGNAGALQVHFNDTDIGSVGLIGQVEELVFNTSGLIQPTPTSTPTITETPQVTPTPSPSPSPTVTEPVGND
jgi:cytoskeletal protein RodZ